MESKNTIDLNNNFSGLKWLIFNEIFTITHIVLIKTLVSDFSVFQIVFIRAISSSVFILPLFLIFDNKNSLLKSFTTNVIRVLSSFLAISIQFYSISNIQLAQASTISYLRPAVLSLIAYFFLFEKQTISRWAVIAIGFASILFIFSPEKSFIQLVAFIAFLGVCFGASSTIIQKHLSKTFSELHLMVWYSVGISIVSMPFALFFWKNPDRTELIFMVLFGLLASSAQFFFIKAYRLSQASFLAPIQYFHILPIMIIGYILFNETPSIQTILGSMTIIISLVLLLLWEKKSYKNYKN